MRAEPFTWLQLDLVAGVEWRWGLDDPSTVLQPTGGGEALTTALRHRTDLRGFGGEALVVRPVPWLSLSLRHDWLANRTELSGVAPGPGSRGVGTSTWSKQVLTGGLAIAW